MNTSTADVELSGGGVIELDLVQQANEHHGVKHPYLQDLAAGRLPDMAWAMRDFAQQYKGYSAAFPQFLTAVISRLEQPGDRAALFENLAEESGHYDPETLAVLADLGVDAEWVVGIPHPELFNRFCRAVGADPDRTGPQSGETIDSACWREQFLSLLLTGTAAEAVGALSFGTEAVVPSLYQAILEGCAHVPHLTDFDIVFFTLHTEVDDGHHEVLAEIAHRVAGTAQGRVELAKGMHKALALRSAFWSTLHERALAPGLVARSPR